MQPLIMLSQHTTARTSTRESTYMYIYIIYERCCDQKIPALTPIHANAQPHAEEHKCRHHVGACGDLSCVGRIYHCTPTPMPHAACSHQCRVSFANSRQIELVWLNAKPLEEGWWSCPYTGYEGRHFGHTTAFLASHCYSSNDKEILFTQTVTPSISTNNGAKFILLFPLILSCRWHNDWEWRRQHGDSVKTISYPCLCWGIRFRVRIWRV